MANSPSLPPEQVTLALLAGGRSTRMGTPKSHLTLHGQPILHYLLDHLPWPGPTLLVTAPGREHPPGHERFSREVPDPVEGQGPLRGILTALDAATTDHTLLLTVDMPALRPEHLPFLLACPPTLGTLLRRPDAVEPFPSLFAKSAADPIRRHLGAGHRSVHSLLTLPGFRAVDTPPTWPPETWTNLNHPQDLESFLSDPHSRLD